MKTKLRYALALCGVLLCIGAGGYARLSFRASKLVMRLPVKTGYLPIPGIKEIRGYKKWRRVNDVPLALSVQSAAQCYAVPSHKPAYFDPKNPHTGKFFSVYVNAIGEKAMRDGKRSNFPVGSIIVKEKLPSLSSTSPELLTVMVKRKRGYNAQHGDWEYLGLNGSATKIDARGKLANCQHCHAEAAKTDYVFGNYFASDELTLPGIKIKAR